MLRLSALLYLHPDDGHIIRKTAHLLAENFVIILLNFLAICLKN